MLRGGVRISSGLGNLGVRQGVLPRGLWHGGFECRGSEFKIPGDRRVEGLVSLAAVFCLALGV